MKYRQKMKEFLSEHGFILPAEVVAEFYKELLTVSGFGLGSLMKVMGKRAGKRGAKLAREKFLGSEETPSWDDLIELAQDFFTETGLGNVEIVSRSQDEIKFRIPGGSVLARYIEAKKPVCGPIAAAAAGFLEELLGKKVDVKETVCASTGADACEFVIRIES